MFWLIFLKNAVENDTGRKCRDRETADDGDHEDHCQKLYADGAQEEDQAIHCGKEECVGKMPDCHQEGILHCLSVRTSEMRYDREDVDKHTGQESAHDPKSHFHDGKQCRLCRIQNGVIQAQQGYDGGRKQPYDGALPEAITKSLKESRPYIGAFPSYHL